MRQSLIVVSVIMFYIISGCTDENPPTVNQPNLYKWEYVYGDSSIMLITTVEIRQIIISYTDIKMIWYSFGELNVYGYEIKYAREQYYQLLGTVNGRGTTTDTTKYTFSTKFENPDSVNFQLIMRKFDGGFDYHQFIVIKL